MGSIPVGAVKCAASGVELRLGCTFKDVTGAAFIMLAAAMESMKPPAAAAIKEIVSFIKISNKHSLI